ncbi:MAG TPA: ribonucleotide-diphosphate reductase subunit alpha, partial [Maribacter sp.]|nr:ribonucleotide-diphosphate reductase subunit alpha [Maribacter sp.]
QSKMLPFNSQEAYNLNSEIFKTIKEKSYSASEELADKFGEPKVLKGFGRRNATLNAIAPTTS